MVDNSIDYSVSGSKGAKERKRLRLHEINNRTMDVTPEKKKYKSTPKEYQRKPEYEERRKKRKAMSDAFYSAIGLKAKVRMLVIDHDPTFLELVDMLKAEGYPLSGVTAGNLRSEMRECMKTLGGLGLLDTEALARRRKRIKAGDAV